MRYLNCWLHVDRAEGFKYLLSRSLKRIVCCKLLNISSNMRLAMSRLDNANFIF